MANQPNDPRPAAKPTYNSGSRSNYNNQSDTATYAGADAGSIGIGSAGRVNPGAPPLNYAGDGTYQAYAARLGARDQAARDDLAEQQTDMNRERDWFLEDRQRILDRGTEDFNRTQSEGAYKANQNRTNSLDDLAVDRAAGQRNISQNAEASGLLRSGQTDINRGLFSAQAEVTKARIEQRASDVLGLLASDALRGNTRLAENDERARSRYQVGYDKRAGDLQERLDAIGSGTAGALADFKRQREQEWALKWAKVGINPYREDRQQHSIDPNYKPRESRTVRNSTPNLRGVI